MPRFSLRNLLAIKNERPSDPSSQNSTPYPHPYTQLSHTNALAPDTIASTTSNSTSYLSNTNNRPESKPIKASAVPQWRWSTLQCREWLAAVCIEYFNMTPQAAQETAKKFYGYGPNIYMWRREEWIELLGQNERGRGLYGMVLGMRTEKGAVPSSVNLLHGNKKG